MFWTHEEAMSQLLIQEGVRSGATVEYIVERGQYLIGEPGWGPFKVSREFVLDLEARFGPEVGWCFLRWATTPDRDRLLVSFQTVNTWDPGYLGEQ